MESYNGQIKPGLMLAAVALIGSGLFGGSVYAGDKDEQTREVMVDCDKGQNLQDVLLQYLDDKKPLEIIVKGTCGEGNEVITIERDKVLLEGDEDDDEDAHINALLAVEQARNIEIGDNMRISSLFVDFGEVSIEAERSVTIDGDVFIVGQSSLTIDTASDDDDGLITTGLVTIGGPITIEGHSLLSVQSNQEPSRSRAWTAPCRRWRCARRSHPNVSTRRDAQASLGPESAVRNRGSIRRLCTP